ncbi:MAG: hypothetical protein ACI8QC_001291 [Planctomycetota bacterium]
MNQFKLRIYASFLLLCLVVSAGASSQDDASPQQVEFFENKIRPVLAEHCYSCHNSIDKKKGGLALDYRSALRESGVIVPGDPAASLLIQALRHAEDVEPMPSKAPRLAKLIIKNFEEWVQMGAPDPRDRRPTREELSSQLDWNAIRDQRKEWWSFAPVRVLEPRTVNAQEWDRSAIDRYVYAGIQAKGLEAQASASRQTLVRRLHLVLTGLPPTPAVALAFIADERPEAYAELVDKLMASKAYAERWARYWMDWYRYAESYGSEGDPTVPYARQYRDYLIRAIAADVPYDQLLREHLAGDLLENPRVNEELGLNESAIGPAHLRMTPHGFGVTDAYEEQITFTDNQIDVVSKAMLGLTVSCARCHNHKFDPISQEDYYRLYGIMISSRPAVVNVDSPARQDLHKSKLAELKLKIRSDFASHWLGLVEPAVQAMTEDKLEGLTEGHPFWAWASLKQVEPDALVKGIQAQHKLYEETLARNEQTKQGATFYADLSDQATYERWFRSGNGLGARVSPAGSFAIAGEGEDVFTGIYPAGVYSHLLSDRHNGFLNSVFHLADGRRAQIRGIGNGGTTRFTARSYPLAHGLLHKVHPLGPRVAWNELGKYKYWNGERVYFQINTAPDNTFNGRAGRAWFGLQEVYAGDGSMQEAGAPLVSLPGDLSVITGRDSLLAHYRSSLYAALLAWQDESIGDAQAQFLGAYVARGFLPNRLEELTGSHRSLIDAYRALENEIREPARAPGVIEGEVWDQPLLARGSYKQEQQPVARGFLEMFSSEPYSQQESGRRELAEDILSESNPLTARVLVNRLWNHTFGRGLVASTDNFGRMGEQPTHPELLDYLASDLRANGWSMKRAVRAMVMSRTFRSKSAATPTSLEKDPGNLQLAYYTPRRLDAEAIYDSIRFVAADGVRERAIYRGVRRNNLDPFLTAFNYPIPTTTVGVRDLTDVPAQSLTLMNGELTKNAAREWSDRLVSDRSLETQAARVNQLFLQAYARHATTSELEACLDYLSGKVVDDTDELIAQRDALALELSTRRADRERLLEPTRSRLQAEVDLRNQGAQAKAPKPVDLKPIARWDFEGDGRDSIGQMHGEIKGSAKFEDGALVLEGGFVATQPLPSSLTEKTLEVLVQLDGLEQRSGGAMSVQTLDGHTFDAIVYAEVAPHVWLAGSDNHQRTDSFHAPGEEHASQRPVRIALVYTADGSTICYRDGIPYGEPYSRGNAQSFAAGESQVVFGIRHGLTPVGGRMLRGRIHEARLYDRALSPAEIAASMNGVLEEVVTAEMLQSALSASQQVSLARLDEHIAAIGADLDKRTGVIAKRRRSMAASDNPYFKIAHALLNSKELIYVH